MKYDLKSIVEQMKLFEVRKYFGLLKEVGGVLMLSYFAAVITNAFVGSGLVSLALNTKGANRIVQSDTVAIRFSEVNYRDLRNGVLDRNLFNSEGTFPEEADPSESSQETAVQVFDPKAPCRDTKLPLTLLGTIYLGNSSQSMATLQEKGYGEADIYKVGDQIIGHETALVTHIDRNSIVINNSGVKECISKQPPEIAKGTSDYFDGDVGGGPPSVSTPSSSSSGSNGSGSVTLKESYVLAQLGEGFANILTKARLVPNYKDNKSNGFKIFGIDRTSLFGKIGLKNNDVITKVNGTELTADKGFEVYRAFQDESEVQLSVVSSSGEARTITVNIE